MELTRPPRATRSHLATRGIRRGSFSIATNCSPRRSSFTAGSGLTAGFNEGLLLMRVGDRKLLLVPSRLGYGPGGYTGIPADAALMFDVEVLGIQ